MPAAPPRLPDVRRSLGRWWTEFAVILERHDNYLYDALALYRAVTILNPEGAW